MVEGLSLGRPQQVTILKFQGHLKGLSRLALVSVSAWRHPSPQHGPNSDSACSRGERARASSTREHSFGPQPGANPRETLCLSREPAKTSTRNRPPPMLSQCVNPLPKTHRCVTTPMARTSYSQTEWRIAPSTQRKQARPLDPWTLGPLDPWTLGEDHPQAHNSQLRRLFSEYSVSSARSLPD
jgi:hypothetical protein